MFDTLETLKDTRAYRETRGAFTITVQIEDDDSAPDLTSDPDKYDGLSPAEIAAYLRADADRLDAYNNGEWHYVGVTVTIRVQTGTGWADGGLEVGRASCWGIESDSDAAYFETTARDLMEEAWHEVEQVRRTLDTFARFPE